MGQPRIQKLIVPTAQDLESTMTSYFAQGFVVVNKTATSATLQKRKEFKVLWAVIGFLLCIIPLLVYLIVYSTQPDVELVEILVAP